MPAPMVTNNPLTQADCKCLDEALASMAITKQLLENCKDCGLDVDGAMDIIRQQEDRAKKLKAKFFPNNP